MNLMGKSENPADIKEFMRNAPTMFQSLQRVCRQLQDTPTKQVINQITSLLLFAKGDQFQI